MEPLEIDTPHGPARAHLHPVDGPRAALILGHGAGGGVGARDLLKATAVANAQQVSVALVEQPYRVAGRRSPAPARQLDAAWEAVCAHLGNAPFAGLPPIVGGRSSGARVACRTARETGAIGVLCLAFPLLAPARRDGERPSRLPELEQAGVPTLVVQGERDRFGIPAAAPPDRTVAIVRGDHALRGDLRAVGEAVGSWLDALLADRPA